METIDEVACVPEQSGGPAPTREIKIIPNKARLLVDGAKKELKVGWSFSKKVRETILVLIIFKVFPMIPNL
jgi:hypothetical protein